MKINRKLLDEYLVVCAERDADPRRCLEFWLQCFIDRTGYAEAAKKCGGKKNK